MLWETEYKPETIDEAFQQVVGAWKNDENKVFVLRASGPVDYDVRQVAEDGFAALGTACMLAEDVGKGDRDSQRSGELWTEVRYDPKIPDAYRHSANAQPLHTDGSYIPDYPNSTLMLCISNAGEGGETIFVDSEKVIEALAVEDGELLDRLKNTAIPHARSGDQRTEKVIDEQPSGTLVNWNYYCVSDEADQEERELADQFFNYHCNSEELRRRTLPVKLGPGDMVLWKDREVLHGRNAFAATQESERFLWKCAMDVGRFGG